MSVCGAGVLRERLFPINGLLYSSPLVPCSLALQKMTSIFWCFYVFISEVILLYWKIKHFQKLSVYCKLNHLIKLLFAFALTVHWKIPWNNFGEAKSGMNSAVVIFLQPAAKRNWAALIPIINSWPLWINATVCQATDFCTVVHHLNSSLLSFVPVSLSDSVSRSRHPAFSRSHLLPLTFCLPRSLLAPFLKKKILFSSCPLLLSLTTLSLSLDLHCLIRMWPKQWTYCCASGRGPWAVGHYVFVCVWSHKHGGNSSVCQREGESLPTDSWKEKGQGGRRETSREMELHTMPAALHWNLTLYLFVLRPCLYPQPAA